MYAEVARASKKLISEMLVRMIESAEDYHNWNLSDEDGARMVKLIKHKQRIICSSFFYQHNRHFTDFKATDGTDARESGLHDWQRFGLSGGSDGREITELEAIVVRYNEAFREFDRSLLKRLQICVRRSRASIYDSPLQVKRLMESYRYAIDSLNLELNFKLAMYHLFTDRFIDSLGPLYRRLDQLMIDRGIAPDIGPARIHLRNASGLSESEPALALDQSATRLMLVQQFKETSRVAGNGFRNYFPDLKERFAAFGINDYDEQIDQLNLIFKLIFEDEDLPAPVKQQLARLQIYVFITAIQEDGFLRRSSNPARRLLDGIVGNEVEIAVNGNSEFSGVAFIREHIDDMASRQFITVDHYTQMLDGYIDWVRENELSIRRQRKLEATRKVMPMVKERLAEITQPLRIQGTPMILFEKVWLPLLVQIALQKGMDSDTWHKTISMVQKQVWSMIPKNSIEEQAELTEALPQVAHSLHRAMRSLKLAEPLQQSLRDFLKLEQKNVAEQTARNIIEAKRKTRSLAVQSFANDEDTSEFDAMMETGVFQVPDDMLTALKTHKAESSKPAPAQVEVDPAQKLNVGDWVNFGQGAAGQLAKLAWRAEDASLFIFVDRDGKRIAELKRDELAQKFGSGEISLTGPGTVDSIKSRQSFMKTL